MKKQLYGFLLVLSLAAGAVAQKAQVAKPDPTEQNLRRMITYLASDALEGRRTGEPGATTAAGYIANMFASLRLKPGARTPGGKASYMQLFAGKGSTTESRSSDTT